MCFRKRGCEENDVTRAENAADPQAGQHCRAEGGLPAKGKALPCL